MFKYLRNGSLTLMIKKVLLWRNYLMLLKKKSLKKMDGGEEATE